MKKSVIVLLHIFYWVVYLSVLTILFLSLNMGRMQVTPKLLLHVLFLKPFGLSIILPGLLGFYTFYIILFNKFLLKKRILELLLSASVIAFSSSLITELVVYKIFHKQGINWGLNEVFTIGLLLAFITVVNGATGLIMKGFINWYNDIKIKVELNKRNYEMELAMLKSQINPHFLFNTINNIDVMITKDAIRASEYLNKLSDIIRFMLYETKPAKIPLHKELTYIEKFIELQKIRTTNEHYVNYSLKGNPENFMIPPMILIPFIENAFKHAENKKAENAITINLEIEEEKISFTCENAYNQSTHIKPEHSSLGSEIIKKRLSLLYPGKHKLTITNNNELYKVELSLY